MHDSVRHSIRGLVYHFGHRGVACQWRRQSAEAAGASPGRTEPAGLNDVCWLSIVIANPKMQGTYRCIRFIPCVTSKARVAEMSILFTMQYIESGNLIAVGAAGKYPGTSRQSSLAQVGTVSNYLPRYYLGC